MKSSRVDVLVQEIKNGGLIALDLEMNQVLNETMRETKAQKASAAISRPRRNSGIGAGITRHLLDHGRRPHDADFSGIQCVSSLSKLLLTHSPTPDSWCFTRHA
jgi:hypothetical protein